MLTMAHLAGRSECLNIDVNFDIARKFLTLTGAATAPQVDVNLKHIAALRAFAEGDVEKYHRPTAKPRDATQLEVIDRLENHRSLRIHFRIDAPVVTVMLSPPINLVLGEISFSSRESLAARAVDAVDSYYDLYGLKFTGIGLSIGTQPIFLPFDAEIDLSHRFIMKSAIPRLKLAVMVTQIGVQLTRDQYLILLGLGPALRQLNPPRAEEPEAEHNPKPKVATTSEPSYSTFDAALKLDGLRLAWIDSSETSIAISGTTITASNLGSSLKAHAFIGTVIGSSGSSKILEFAHADRSLELDFVFDQTGTQPTLQVGVDVAALSMIVDPHWVFQMMDSLRRPEVRRPARRRSSALALEVQPKALTDYAIRRILETALAPIITVKTEGVTLTIPGPPPLTLHFQSVGFSSQQRARVFQKTETYYYPFDFALNDLSVRMDGSPLLEEPMIANHIEVLFVPCAGLETMKLECGLGALAATLERQQYAALRALLDDVRSRREDRPPTPRDPSSDNPHAPRGLRFGLKAPELRFTLVDTSVPLQSSFALMDLEANVQQCEERRQGSLKIGSVLVSDQDGRRICALDEAATLSFAIADEDDSLGLNLEWSIGCPVFSYDLQWMNNTTAFFAIENGAAPQTEKVSKPARRPERRIDLSVQGKVQGVLGEIAIPSCRFCLAAGPISLTNGTIRRSICFAAAGLSLSCNEITLLHQLSVKTEFQYSFKSGDISPHHISVSMEIPEIAFDISWDVLDALLVQQNTPRPHRTHHEVEPKAGPILWEATVSINAIRLAVKLRETTTDILFSSFSLTLHDQRMFVRVRQVSGAIQKAELFETQEIDSIVTEVLLREPGNPTISLKIPTIKATLKTDFLLECFNVLGRYFVIRSGHPPGPIGQRKGVFTGELEHLEFTIDSGNAWRIIGLHMRSGLCGIPHIDVTMPQVYGRIYCASFGQLIRDYYAALPSRGGRKIWCLSFDIRVITMNLDIHSTSPRVLQVTVTEILHATIRGLLNVRVITIGSIVAKNYLSLVNLGFQFDLTLSQSAPNPRLPAMHGLRAYVANVVITGNLDSFKLNYERGKSDILCLFIVQVMSIMFRPHKPGYVSVKPTGSGKLTLGSAELILNDVAARRLASFSIKAATLDMLSDVKMILQIGQCSMFDDAIVPMMNGTVLKLDYTPDLIDVQVASLKGNVDIPTTAAVASVLMQSPFVLTKRWKPYPPSGKARAGVSVVLSPALIGIPISPEHCPDYVYVTIGGAIIRSPTVFAIALKRLSISFANEKDGAMHPPLLERGEIRFHKQNDDDQIYQNFGTAPLQFHVTALDIALFVLLLKYAVPTFKAGFPMEIARRQKSSRSGAPIPTLYKFDFGGADLLLSRENRGLVESSPILRAHLVPFHVELDSHSTRKSALKMSLPAVEVFNFETGLFDMIVEPINLTVFIRFLERDTKIRLAVAHSIALNISMLALQELLKVFQEIKSRVSSKSAVPSEQPEYSVVNRTGIALAVQVIRETFELADSDAASRPYFGSDSLVSLPTIANAPQFEPSELNFPLFLRPNIIAYAKNSKRGKMIVISSPLRVRNLTNLSIQLITKEKVNRPVVALAPHEKKNVPFYEKITARFAFIEYGLPLSISPSTFVLGHLRSEIRRVITIPTRRGPRDFILFGGSPRGTHVFTLIVSPITIIQNRLPFDMTFQLEDEVIAIPPGGNSSTSLIARDDDSVEIMVGLGTANGLTPSLIHPKQVNCIKCILPGADGIATLACHSHPDTEKKQLRLTFYAPALVYNMTPFELSGFDPVVAVETPFVPGALTPGIWGCQSFFEEKSKLSLDLIFEEFRRVSVAPIDCLSPISAASLRVEIRESLFVPLRYTVKSAEPTSPSMIVTIFSNVEVQNEMSHDISLQPSTGPDGHAIGNIVRLFPGAKVQLRQVTQCCLFAFLLEGDDVPVIISLEHPIRLTFITESGFLVDLEIEEVGADLRATFRPASIPQPYMIANFMPETTVLARQGERSARSMAIAPDSTGIFALTEPIEYPTLFLEIDGTGIEVELTELFRVRQYQTSSGVPFFVAVVSNPNATRSIVVSADFQALEDLHREGNAIDVKLEIPLLFLSVMSEEPRELALLTLRHVVAQLGRNRFLTNFKVFAHSLTVDDIHPESVIDVVAIGDPCDESHFIEFRASMFTNAPFLTSFDIISLDVQPVRFFLDVAFVSDLFSFATRLVPRANKAAALQPLQPSSRRSESARIPLSTRLLQIGSLDATAYLLNKSGRPFVYEMVYSALKLVPNNLAGTSASVDPISLGSVVMNYATFRVMLRQWIRQIKTSAVRIVFGSDILTAPLPIGQNFARIVERCGANTARVVASAAVQPIENVLRKGQQVLNWIQFDDSNTAGVHGLNQTASQTIQTGFKNAGKSFLSAFTGLVLDPIRESKKAKYRNRAAGVVVGIGKGLAGVVVKPVQSVIEAGTGLVTGIRKAAEGDEEVLTKQRAARGFPRRQIVPYNGTVAALQEICLIEEGELLENVYQSQDGARLLVITKRHVFVIAAGPHLEDEIDIRDVTRQDHEEGVIRLTHGTNKVMRFDCESEEQAVDFMKRVRSNLYMLRIGYESE
jgi:hypothetical protein